MFDINEFKKKVKEWMQANPQGTEADLIDFCEDIIPSSQYSAYGWLVEQTRAWYQSILKSRREDYSRDLDDDLAE